MCHRLDGGLGLCDNCGFDGQCGEGNLCVRHWNNGRPWERFCGSGCDSDEDCPRGWACGQVGQRGDACLPDGIEFGLTCEAIRDLGSDCETNEDCGLTNEGRCWEGRCTYGCNEVDDVFRLCPEGFSCQPVPEQFHVWGAVCLPDE
jgi:hypothetical protein